MLGEAVCSRRSPLIPSQQSHAMAPSAVHIAASGIAAEPATSKLAKATSADGPGWAQNMTGEAGLVTPRPAWWWTGAAPRDAPGYREERQQLTALPLTVRARARSYYGYTIHNAA